MCKLIDPFRLGRRGGGEERGRRGGEGEEGRRGGEEGKERWRRVFKKFEALNRWTLI